MADNVRIHALVGGAVQGVGFRYNATEKARELGISGWVRNLPDGRVEAEAEGSAQAVGAFAAWLRTGPEWADVDGVETSEIEPTGASGFDLRH